MRKTKILWLAKDGGIYKDGSQGMIGVYSHKPKEEESLPFFEGDFIAQIPASIFPEITYGNSPVKVELRILDDEI
jgi:hypothetical protein